MHEIWCEKYRPSNLSQVHGSAEAIKRLSQIALTGNMPHLMISGPPGTGKTSTILALAHTLLGPHIKDAFLELNASDDRGIDVIRDRVKSFVKAKVVLPPGKHKIVLLDEADSMTQAAQQALRRLMEIYSFSTRFALTCNISSKVIEPIQSRCALLRFEKLKDQEVLSQLLHICETENINYVESGLQALVYSADGDMRTAINNLQSTSNGFGTITKENVVKVCDVPPPEVIKGIIEDCLQSNWREARTVANSLLDNGYSAVDILAAFKSVLKHTDINEVVSLEYLKLISRCHFVVADGVSTVLQLDALLANLCTVAKELISDTPVHAKQK